MNSNSISDFLAMGGYAAYVWGSVGVVAVSMALEVAMLGNRWRTVREKLRRACAGKKARG